MKFHLTDDGPKRCTATKRPCPLGGEDSHFTTEREASVAFEARMDEHTLPPSRTKPFTMKLSSPTKEVVDRLSNAGIRSLIVGGSVRDQFLGKESKDIDFELYGARPNGESLQLSDVKVNFPRSDGFHVDEAGESFSVLKIRYKGEDFDVALPRTEQSTGEHHRDYELQHDSTMSFEEAASRRDFTINSMGYDPVTGELLDPYGGQKDLQNKTLRHVSSAFSDDPLRSLRAVNFVSRFNLDVAPETRSLCRELAPAYETIAKERVREEFDKVFYKGQHLEKAFGTLHDIGWAQRMEPFKESSREDLTRYGKTLDSVEPPYRKAALALMLREDRKPEPFPTLESAVKERAFAKRSLEVLDAADTGDWPRLVAAHRDLKKAHPSTSNEEVKSFLSAVGKDSELVDRLPETPVEPAVTGKWLLEKGVKPGPDMGRVIKAAQELQDRTGRTDADWLYSEASK